MTTATVRHSEQDVLDTKPELLSTSMDLSYAYSGPNVPVPHGDSSVVPNTVRVTVEVEHLPSGNISLRATKAIVYGLRAKRDGTAGQVNYTAEFWLATDSARVPTGVMDIVGKATAQVRLWVERGESAPESAWRCNACPFTTTDRDAARAHARTHD